MSRKSKYMGWGKSMDAEAHVSNYHGFVRFSVVVGVVIAAILFLLFWTLT